jgi:hypothetical protein
MGTYLWTRLCVMWKSKAHIGSLYGLVRIIYGQSRQNMETISTWAHTYGLDYALCGNQKDILVVSMDHQGLYMDNLDKIWKPYKHGHIFMDYIMHYVEIKRTYWESIGPLRIIYGQSIQIMETIYTWAHTYGLHYGLCGNQNHLLVVCMDH